MSEKTWGGNREGAGRKPTNTKTVWVRLTDEQHEKLKKLGGSAWLQNVIEKESKMTSTEIIKLLKDEIKDAEKLQHQFRSLRTAKPLPPGIPALPQKGIKNLFAAVRFQQDFRSSGNVRSGHRSRPRQV